MSPVRRRSARLASTSVKPNKTTMIPNLTSVNENEESPEHTPMPKRVKRAAMPSAPSVPGTPHSSIQTPMTAAPKTPSGSSPVKPAHSEMHPSHAPRAVAPPSSAYRLGFTDIDNTKPADRPELAQGTPSKTIAPSGDFTFRVARPSMDLKLGPDAQRMMEEIREQAKKIKADLAAKREVENEEPTDPNRKIAKPKGKATRYSAVHMAQFKKMDSIANHPSAFRAQPGRITPNKPAMSLKRTKSKANLDEPESRPVSIHKKRAAPASAASTRIAGPKTKSDTSSDEPVSPVKRVKKQLQDDASTNRPVSRDGGNIPRPASRGNLSNLSGVAAPSRSLMTPTKASLTRSANTKTPGSLLRTPSRLHFSGLKKSTTTRKKPEPQSQQKPKAQPEPATQVTSPNASSKLAKMKSLFRPKTVGAEETQKVQTGLPVPQAVGVSKTPGSSRIQMPLPAVAMTTPGGRKLQKRVGFTPDMQRTPAPMAATPTPIKSSLPKPSASTTKSGPVLYPNLTAVLMEENEPAEESETVDEEVVYPTFEATSRPTSADDKIHNMPSTVPGTFTFRSDHTINFGSTSPSGFGGSPGQSSLRQVRKSVMPTADMPGAFPSGEGSNKENSSFAAATSSSDSRTYTGIPHGVKNKKRHRASWDEEDAEREAAARAKKARMDVVVPEGDALFGTGKKSRVIATPVGKGMRRFGGGTTVGKRMVGSPSPVKKRGMLSVSRLNMLAMPKRR